jgi:hypothetical protein
VPLPTLTDLKAETNIPTTADDDELQIKLDQAVRVVEGIVGPIEAQTVTETHYDLWWSREILLRRSPATALVSVTERTSLSSTFVTVASSDYELNTAAGKLRTRNSRRLSGDVTVTYSAGRVDVPADIAGAIVIIAAHLWETQRMPGQSLDSAPAGFGGADGIPDIGSMGRGYAIPSRAQELLQPYMRQSIA